MDRKKQIAALRAGGVPTRFRNAIFDAGAATRRTLGWQAPTTYPNQVLNFLTRLRDRSRNAVRNNSLRSKRANCPTKFCIEDSPRSSRTCCSSIR